MSFFGGCVYRGGLRKHPLYFEYVQKEWAQTFSYVELCAQNKGWVIIGLTLIDLTWFYMAGIEMTYHDILCLDLTWLVCVVLSWHVSNCLDLTWLNYIWLDLIYLDLAWIGLAWLYWTLLDSTELYLTWLTRHDLTCHGPHPSPPQGLGFIDA